MRTRDDTSLEELIEEIDSDLGERYRGEEFLSKVEKVLNEHNYVLGDYHARIRTIGEGKLQREITEVYEADKRRGMSNEDFEDEVVLYFRGRSEDQDAGAVFIEESEKNLEYNHE